MGERGLDRLDRHEGRVDALGLLEATSTASNVLAACSNARWMPGVERVQVQVGADRDALAGSPCARPPVSASKNRRTSSGVRAIGPAWSSERASGKTPVGGIRL